MWKPRSLTQPGNLEAMFHIVLGDSKAWFKANSSNNGKIKSSLCNGQYTHNEYDNATFSDHVLKTWCPTVNQFFCPLCAEMLVEIMLRNSLQVPLDTPPW